MGVATWTVVVDAISRRPVKYQLHGVDQLALKYWASGEEEREPTAF